MEVAGIKQCDRIRHSPGLTGGKNAVALTWLPTPSGTERSESKYVLSLTSISPGQRSLFYLVCPRGLMTLRATVFPRQGSSIILNTFHRYNSSFSKVDKRSFDE